MSAGGNGRPARAPVSRANADHDDWEWPPIPLRRRIANTAFWIGCFVCLAGVITPAVWFSVSVVAGSLKK